MTKNAEHELNLLNKKLAKQNSLKEEFKRGIVRGVGAAIGASIVVVIVLTILAWVINTVDDVPILKDAIEKSQIKDAIDD